MPSRTLPNLGLKGFYDIGENGWGADMSASLLKLSVLVQGGVKSRLAAVPDAPEAGDIHILTADPNKNAVAVYDAGAWVYYAPSEGWLLYDRGADKYLTFDGAAWAVLATGSSDGGGGDPDPDPGEGGGGTPTVVSARYWRIVFPAASANTYSCAIATMELRAVAGGPSIAAGGTAFARGDQGADNSAAKAFDGNAATFWAHSPSGDNNFLQSAITWLGYDFGAAVAIAEIQLVGRSDGAAAGQTPVVGVVQCSDDGVSYRNAGGYGLGGAPVGGQVITFPALAAGGGGGGGGSASYPAFGGNAGKALVVNDAETGVEWAEIVAAGADSTSGWEVVASWNGATQGPIDNLVASVEGYTDLILSFDRVQSGNSNRLVRFSTDGGLTWVMGDNYHTDLNSSGGVAYNDGAAYQAGSSVNSSMHYLVSGIDAKDSPKLMLGNRNIFFTGYDPITNVYMECGGAYAGRMTILGKRKGADTSRPVSKRPKIVQMVKGRTKNASGDLTFGKDLTPGNMVVILWAGASSAGHLVPEGFQTIGYNSNDNSIEGQYRPGLGNKFQAGYAAIRRVIAGDPRNIYVQAGGDVNNWLLLEISDADMVDFQVARMQKDDNTHFRTNRMRQPYNSLDLFMLEHDDVGALTPDVGTVLMQFNGTVDGDNYNHAAVVVDASDVDGDLTGTCAAGALNYPVAFRLSVAKYQGGIAGGRGGKSWYFDPPSIADLPVALGPNAGTLTKAEDDDVGLILGRIGNSFKRAGYGVAVPAGNWTATCRIEANFFMQGGSAAGAGLIVSNPAKDKYFEWGQDNRNYMEMARFNNDGYDGWENSINVPGAFPPFFRMVYDAASGNLSYEFSQHGKVFTQAGVRNVKADFGGNDPGFVGLALRTEGIDWLVSAAFQMFTVE